MVFCFVFLLKQRQHYLGSLSCVEYTVGSRAVRGVPAGFLEGVSCSRKCLSSVSQSPEDGNKLRLGCSVEMPSLPSRTKWAPLSAEPRGWCSGLPAPSVVSLNLPVLLQAAAFTLQSCRDLMPQSAHLKRGERRVASLPAPPVPHKHFRAMQGRKLCLAFPPLR